MRVGLTYERDTINTGCSPEVSAISESLRGLGHEVVMIGSAIQLVDKLAAGDRYDAVFNCCRTATTAAGQAHIPVLLDVYKMACTFSPPTTLNICNQRSTLKSLLRDRGVPTSDYWVVETLGDIQRVDTTYPVTVSSTLSCYLTKQLIAKDANELSKACCLVMSQGTPAIVEPQLAGTRVVAALIGSGTMATCLLPDDVNAAWSNSIQRTMQAAWRTVGGCDAGVMILHCDANGQPHVMSIDALPSLAMNDPLIMLAQAAGLTLDDVINRILQSAAQRAGLETLQPHLSRTTKQQGVSVNS